MSLTINAVTGNAAGTAHGTEKTAGNIRNGKTLDARQLTLGYNEDTCVSDKRKNARNQAMKMISDAWARDDERIKKIDDLNKEKSDAVSRKIELQKRMGELERSKESLREEYGVSKDSGEQKDLELLEKYQNNIQSSANDKFSEEEIARLKELQNEPLTEYQKKVLSLNGAKNGLVMEIEKIDGKLEGMSLSILMAETEQVKSQDMIKSQDAADQILEAAERDILKKLINDGKEAVDEKREEAEEKAEEIEEKKEETGASDKTQEEKAQQDIIKGEAKAESLEQNYKIKQQSADNVSEAQKQIQKIMSDNSLINEDLKGIKIDLDF